MLILGTSIHTVYVFILRTCVRAPTNLVAPSDVVRHVLEAAHHPLVPEVIGEGLGPLRQQLHQLGGHLADTDLTTQQGVRGAQTELSEGEP